MGSSQTPNLTYPAVSPQPMIPLAVVGMECRLPGAPNVAAYEQLLFQGRSGFGPMPESRFDRSLYFQSRKGLPGISYTELGGCVEERPANLELLGLDSEEACVIDPVHLSFAEVAVQAWLNAGLSRNDQQWKSTGVFVGHSGATKLGGCLNLASHIEEGLDFLNDLPSFQQLPPHIRQNTLKAIAARIRAERPHRRNDGKPGYNGYTAASLPANILGLDGPRIVCDAACASSLFAMQQAAMAIRQGRIDAAIVGGATTNGVDNLILFSQSQACSASGSRPFDQGASGLISSEGYAAVVVMPIATAKRFKLPILGVITGLGTASDGRGKSLWAPRQEGQQLAIRRAYPGQTPLDIDYLEAHATSTQLGDATELHAVSSIIRETRSVGDSVSEPLLMGSAKSNLGHTLETAGVAGLVKILLGMKRQEIPASLNFEQPNQNFDWDSRSIQIVHKNRHWIARNQFRRSAVSAFGIGGLNAHLTVTEPTAATSLEQKKTSQTDTARTVFTNDAKRSPIERIAIVGRGVVLPGAHHISQFRDVLGSGKSMIGPAPADRWRQGVNLSAAGQRRPFSSPTNHGGYIRNYVFDAQPYRIPPKQVKQANPIQMMLLDAVTQAATEFDGGKWSIDTQRAGVVIGTVFGGDFGSQLQLGLRIPEIARELSQELRSHGVPQQDIDELTKSYRNHVLAERPALLDETGSFTASTLASRVAKTFDLMGGACAIDVDDASGLAALQLSLDLLRNGDWDLAICGAADRSMDLMKFEQLDLRGKLVRSGRPEDIPDDCQKWLPGEGVVVLFLQRLSDAVAAGRTILGIIDDVELHSTCTDATPTAPIQSNSIQDAALVRQFGYLTGAQSLVQLVKNSVDWESGTRHSTAPPETISIQSHTEDGVQYSAQCSSPATAHVKMLIPQNANQVLSQQISAPLNSSEKNLRTSVLNSGHTQPATPRPAMQNVGQFPVSQHIVSQHTANQPAVNRHTNGQSTGRHPDKTASKAFRLGGRSASELIALVSDSIQHPDVLFHGGESGFHAEQANRLVVLADTPDQLKSRLSSLLKQLHNGRHTGAFESDRGLLWKSRPQTVRTAWAFPGQGSQYSGHPAALQEHSPFADALARFDVELKKQRLEPLQPQLGKPASQFADIWWNQVWVLGLSIGFIEELRHYAPRPDVVLGHSFGEYSALVAAGVLTTEQAIRMVKARANSVCLTVKEPGQLISVRATPSTVEAIVRQESLPAQITHYNAPQQTVIATSVDQVEFVRSRLTAANLASVVVPVPVAYHTSRLDEAESLLKQNFASERFLPSRCAVMSTTSVRYLIDPVDLRESLVGQMTRPVMYVPAIERLLADDVGVLIEVGPNNVLSRMNQDIAGDRAICLSIDAPGKGHSERLQLLGLVQEIISEGSFNGTSEATGTTLPVASIRSAINEPVHYTNGNGNGNGHVLSNGHGNSQSNGHGAVLPSLSASANGHHQTSVTSAPPVDDVEIIDLRRATPKKNVARQVSKPDVSKAFASEVRSYPQAVATTTTLSDSAIATSEEEIQLFLKTVVVDLTGYEPDVVDFDADLEADLGVDSIKKAQVVGEMAEQFSLAVTPSGVRLGDLKTLRDIARLGAQSLIESGGALEASSGSSVIESSFAPPAPVEIPESVSNEATSAPATAFDVASAERFLIDLVVDQTGYSPDVVDLDADMEADLGIDSIKQAQLIGEVQQQFELTNIRPERTPLSTLTTLRSILNFLQDHLGSDDQSILNEASSVANSTIEISAPLKKNTNGEPHQRVIQAATLQPSNRSLDVEDHHNQSGGGNSDHEIRGISPSDTFPDEWTPFFVVPENGQVQLTWQSGRERGQLRRQEIRSALRRLHDIMPATSAGAKSLVLTPQMPPAVEADLAGLANGAGVSFDSVKVAYTWLKSAAATSSASSTTPVESPLSLPEISSFDLSGQAPPVGTESMRFMLRIVPAPQREGMPTAPVLTGPGLVIGNNKFAQALVRRFEESGYPCTVLPETSSQTELDAALDQAWASSPTPHLFITTSHDADALNRLDALQWEHRRYAALEVPYRVCQRWMQRTIDENRMDGGSVVLLTNLGGDFGFSGQTAISSEGGLAGLIKAMLIECWMRGFRATPMKVIDISPATTPNEAVNGMFAEIAVPSYDMEVAYHGQKRFTVQPIHRPLFPMGEIQPAPKNGHSQIRQGGVWVVTGGARGITSVVARELAKRHHLKLHLVGTAPVPQLTDAIRRAAEVDRLQLRREVMKDANLRNRNGMEAWRNVEKAIEIDATLSLMRSEGINAEYHSCDVSRFEDLSLTLQRIREKEGRIDGIIHGAGIGQDARFDRKRPDKVDQCLRAKIDGCLNLMDATRADRLDWFVSFGSISGRFGANGHTDYSLANDSLAKLTDKYRQERPDVRSVTFHWHAWGDIGMATKPETKLALEMINLEFMPASEGLSHFLHELEHGGAEPEVLITDHAYFRKFFPVDRLKTGQSAFQRERATLPMLSSENNTLSRSSPASITLLPKREPFLNQHLVQSKPTLPFVVALELMCEAARNQALELDVLEIRNLKALQAIKWNSDAAQTLNVHAELKSQNVLNCAITADLFRQDGRLVAKDKRYFEGEFHLGQQRSTQRITRPDMTLLSWEPIQYLPPEAPIYHGPDLQCLQQFSIVNNEAFGLISASSTVQLGGGRRPTFGWSIHPAVMDACLYGAAVFAGRLYQKPSLPVGFDRIVLGRLADPGEACLLQVQLVGEEERGLNLAFQLIGLNGDLLMDVSGYRVGWLN
ncbi:SDR family NAD(P)-dependent oxidoreductase [Planctomicrobium sp. SH527]|uniref:SDR family NAD(P)-dependent oxidoreductase n=1 Tax=Planctomicrobium sp. SH527 TaxID=3448123 RepID=UPI003F5BE711